MHAFPTMGGDQQPTRNTSSRVLAAQGTQSTAVRCPEAVGSETGDAGTFNSMAAVFGRPTRTLTTARKRGVVVLGRGAILAKQNKPLNPGGKLTLRFLSPLGPHPTLGRMGELMGNSLSLSLSLSLPLSLSLASLGHMQKEERRGACLLKCSNTARGLVARVAKVADF